MITPLLVAFPGSQWRSHVKATWAYLQEHYKITDDKDCSTHIHISVEGGYSLEELKRIASSVIHFEPALEALVPDARRQVCGWARSSWIDSHDFAAKGASRASAILKISRVTDFQGLLRLMNPSSQRGYGWNFRAIMKYYTIEFRKPPASKTANEALGWAELAMSFVQTSIRYGSLERLKVIPPTVGGLRWFLRQNHVSRINEPERLNWIWEDKDPNAYVEGRSFEYEENSAQLRTIRKMIEADKMKIQKLIKRTQEPYWPDESFQA